MNRFLCVMMLAVMGLCVSSARGQLAMEWYTIDGGGQTNSVNGSMELGGTIGQPDAGAMGDNTTVLYGGFWVSELLPAPCPADYNNDGGIDGSDVEAFYIDWEAEIGRAHV